MVSETSSALASGKLQAPVAWLCYL